jgi:hypothetical protein
MQHEAAQVLRGLQSFMEFASPRTKIHGFHLSFFNHSQDKTHSANVCHDRLTVMTRLLAVSKLDQLQ